jgi:hypothetical protein
VGWQSFNRVRPTGGSLRVFRQFVWLEAGNASRWAVSLKKDKMLY